MLKFFRRKKQTADLADPDACAELAGRLFDRGHNCTQAVLQATTGRDDQELLAMAKAFGGGIGDSGCLCGAVTGGVMALGLSGKEKQAARLMTSFKDEFRTTCCKGLSKDHRWLSREHLANCRKITTRTASIVARLLQHP